MSDLNQALSGPGPHTVVSLSRALPGFPPEAIREALEALTAQGVLAKEDGADGPEYRYVAPERYAQANLDVIKNPGERHNRRQP
jgi:hypothetical protein